MKARGQHDVLDSPDLKGRRTDTSSDDIWQQEKVILRMTIMIIMITMIRMMIKNYDYDHDNNNSGGEDYDLKCQ